MGKAGGTLSERVTNQVAANPKAGRHRWPAFYVGKIGAHPFADFGRRQQRWVEQLPSACPGVQHHKKYGLIAAGASLLYLSGVSRRVHAILRDLRRAPQDGARFQ